MRRSSNAGYAARNGRDVPSNVNGTATKRRRSKAKKIGERSMTAEDLRERLREIGNPRFGAGMSVPHDTDQAKDWDAIAAALHELTEDGEEAPDRVEPRLLLCSEYHNALQDGPCFSVRGTAPMLTVDPWAQEDAILDGEGEEIDNKAEEFAAYVGDPRRIIETWEELLEIEEYAERYADFDHNGLDFGSEIFVAEELAPPVRQSKNGKTHGGVGPGNHVSARVQATAPQELKERRRLEREFWREVKPGGRVPYDRHCENCRRRLPHTREGLRVLIELLTREGAEKVRIDDLSRILAAA